MRPDFWFGLAIALGGCAIMLWSHFSAREFRYYVVYSFQSSTGPGTGRTDITTKWKIDSMSRVEEVEQHLLEKNLVNQSGISKLFLTHWIPIAR